MLAKTSSKDRTKAKTIIFFLGMTVPEVGLGFLVIARPNPQNAPPKKTETIKLQYLVNYI
jgi:hypothetical protein